MDSPRELSALKVPSWETIHCVCIEKFLTVVLDILKLPETWTHSFLAVQLKGVVFVIERTKF